MIKTTVGGATWDYTGLSESQAYIYGVALDSANPAHILAGGTVTSVATKKKKTVILGSQGSLA